MKKIESSIIMSTYNHEKSLIQSINSILSQKYEDFEFLILNDNSTDGTKEVLDKFKKKDSRIKVLNNYKNLGLTKSLNILIKESKGSLIFRQDSDDISLPNRLMKQVSLLRHPNNHACVTRAANSLTLKKIPNISYYFPYKLVMKLKNPFIHGTLGVKKEVLYDVGLYDERFYYAQDYHLYKKLIMSKYRIIKVREILYILNTENNISNSFKDEQDVYASIVKSRDENI
jgi:glycosyltransferase involved in cell wall biosynthesis|tara:strand:- start:29315 stop:30001 length:687 start_codon:yes stop_codon:yes gene_type:complete